MKVGRTRWPCLLVISIAFLRLSASSGMEFGAAKLRFDFGRTDGSLNPVAVDAATRFSEKIGYGWVSDSPLEVRHRKSPKDQRRNFVLGVKPATFRIAGLRPGKYLLTVVSGDMDYGDHVTRVNVSGNAIGLPALAPAASEFATLAATINTTGNVDVAFDTTGANWIVNELTLEPVTKDQKPRVALNTVAAPNDIEPAMSTILLNVEPSQPAYLPEIRFHLTARPWQPVNAPRSELLERMQKALRALAAFQYWNTTNQADEKNGAIIDPYDHTEIQYGTPTFAFNVATLLTEGRAEDLVTAGARALDRASLNIATGYANQGHGEFFCAPMAKAIRMFAALQSKYPQVITPERLKLWQTRMARPRQNFMYLQVRQNWRTFAMKGEWLRQQDGYITDGVDWIEKCWTNWDEGDQRARFLEDRDIYHLNPYFLLYHDNRPNPPHAPKGGPTYSGADPQTFTYNGAVAANLLDMLANGYNGPAAKEMTDVLGRAMQSSLLLMGGSGEAPAGGRTGEHCWDDTIYANAFQDAANFALGTGDLRLAGQYRHATQLLLKSHKRFQQDNGLFSITKNLFPVALKNHYATWSGVANYEDFDLGCCAEMLLADKTNIVEQPTPSEIGGYAVQLDPSFSAVFLDAGGMQAQICTRGETDNYGLVQWHTFGITRFSRVGWDGRLGPGAGGVNNDFSDGVSFSPVFLENGKWMRVCLEPKRFQGSFHTEFVHPLLVRGTFTIAPARGQTGPTFEMHVTLTPDCVLLDTTRVSGTNEFGVIWPLFSFDGKTTLNTNIGHLIASTAYPGVDTDQQNFIALKSTQQLDANSPAVRTGYGDCVPVRVTDSKDGTVETLVYPRSAGDPDAETVRASFHRNGQNFSSVLGRVNGNIYVGRTSAGGEGRGIDLNNDGKEDVSFDQTCAFILQLDHGRIIAMESDRAVTATVAGKQFPLAPYSPLLLP